MLQSSHLGVISSANLEPHSPFFFFWAWFIPSGWKHDNTLGLVHLPERHVLLGRRQRWAKHFLVFLLCSLETKEVFLALWLVGKSYDRPICEKLASWGLWWCISEPTTELKVVQGWSTSSATCVHRNRIVPHHVRMVLQGNVWLTCNALGLSPSGQTEKGCS